MMWQLLLCIAFAESRITDRSNAGCNLPEEWYRLDWGEQESSTKLLRSYETRNSMSFICDAEQTESSLYPDKTKCRVSCPKNMRPTDPEIVCSCYRAAGDVPRDRCRWMPRRRYTPMKCVQADVDQNKDTFDLQHQMMFNLMPGEIEQTPSLSAQESPVREIEFEFVVFDPASEVQFNPVAMGPFEMTPTFNVSEVETIKIDDEHIGDDIVFSRFQAKSLRKAGYNIPSYRVLPTNLEVAARFGITRSGGTSAAISTSAATGRRVGDRAAIVAVNSKMVKSRWTKYKKNGSYIVPFYFSASFPGSREIRKEIASHVEWFNKETNFCIKIEEVDRFDKQYEEKIRIIDGNGCWSYIGMTGDNPQDISLGTLCHTRGLALHEFLHALGFDHEQNRPDRDEHIEVHWENIAPTKKWNFQILGDGDWENTGSPYDFLSVMHYSSANFAAGSKPTMTRRDNGEAVRAQRNRPSTLDISQVCHIYGCPEHCGHEMRQCKNGQEVFKHRFCDGIIDCEDESDEESCDWGCCSNFEITLNGRTHAYSRAETDGKYLFSFFHYWGFAQTLGQPSFYYHAKWDGQCPDEALFWYYSWTKGGKDTMTLNCIDDKVASVKDEVDSETANFFAASIFKESTTTATTTTTRTTTTTKKSCQLSDLPRIPDGKWSCSASSCSASCNNPTNFELVCNKDGAESAQCFGGLWSRPHNSACFCKKRAATCGKLVAIPPMWLNRNAKYSCTDGDKATV
ncbi:Oidioi.mRNA.OKI2018_I69.XSR.g15107.t1.cds [Oikopleura dioica]|uniref:Metalloendopeptidase n=1 Tax=Oikopleura dioica TaxID=34765 RepID=A0ABN7SBT5_OIKDI|nr:Oidioi.mRNA.OKI2018_I69.XSR.g15107.t1.cds [Oikopleura dioica]